MGRLDDKNDSALASEIFAIICYVLRRVGGSGNRFIAVG